MEKITFFLMGLKGLAVLQKLVEELGADYFECVIIAKDKNVEKDYYDEIKSYCLLQKLKVFDRSENFRIQSKYAIAIAWRWMIQLDNTKLIVLHDSLLPKYRGFAPLATALIKGERSIGVTALFASDEYDTGDIIAQSSIDIDYPIKIKDAIELISKCYIELTLLIVNKICMNKLLESRKQNEDEATYSIWLDDDDYHIAWEDDASNIKRFIDSVSFPFKGAVSIINNRRVTILDAEVVEDKLVELRHAGKIIFLEDGKPVVICGKGLLKINIMKDAESSENLIPFNKFRTKFK